MCHDEVRLKLIEKYLEALFQGNVGMRDEWYNYLGNFKKEVHMLCSGINEQGFRRSELGEDN
jgi:hypothetical protein